MFSPLASVSFFSLPTPFFLATALTFGVLPVLNLVASDHNGAAQALPSSAELEQLPEDGGKEFNRLVFEKSPYLLQHAGNPVDWRPWGPEAFEEAARQDKPVFLSIGYSTCHWCHVMEKESFEDDEVANFIPVKVDREERPDIDEVYMTFTQAFTGSGGWPMTVILTPEKKPFFAGTYFPKTGRPGRPGMTEIVPHIAQLWQDRREDVLGEANRFTEALSTLSAGSSGGGTVSSELIGQASEALAQQFDSEYGGFGTAPKFPVPPDLMLLLRASLRSGDQQAWDMVNKSLTSMRRGGIYDHVGFGLHRYSTDRKWLVPHFEKMLYDQALFTLVNLEAYQYSGDERFAEIAREVLQYVSRDMTSPQGGFYSAEDADSEGEEGKFYLWTKAEAEKVLGPEDGEFLTSLYHFSEEGNFRDEALGRANGTNIPHLLNKVKGEDEVRLEALRKKLWAAREKRIHPLKDDKIMTDWNGLMIAAFARAGQVLKNPNYTQTAKKAADFILSELSTEDGRLLKRWRLGEAGLPAHLEDYTFLTWGLLDLYEATFEVRYLAESVRLTKATLDHFWDEKTGGFFLTADDSEQLLVRPKNLYGGAIPSGNAVALLNLARLYRMTADPIYEEKAEALLQAFSGELASNPSRFPLALCALDLLRGPAFEITISGDLEEASTQAMVAAVRKPFLPNKVVLFHPANDGKEAAALAKLAPFTAEQLTLEGGATAYVCQNFACKLPTTDVEELQQQLFPEKITGEATPNR